jgi:hypothetical protein
MSATATLIENDSQGYSALINQLENRSQPTKIPEAQIEKSEVMGRPDEVEIQSKRYSFKKGEHSFDIDEDAEIEFMADKAPVKMTLKELKDRAAGDVAIKNRMHALAEEKKKVQATLKEFTSLSKKDPLKALEFISRQAKEADSEFEYDKYLAALADQADKLSQMTEDELKYYKTEKKLEEVEGELSQEKQAALISQMRQESIARLDIEESQFNEAAQRILNNEELMSQIESEDQFFQTVEEMVTEAKAQVMAVKAINRIDPALGTNQSLIFELADWIQDNPDFTESDIQEIVAGVFDGDVRQSAEQRLSNRQRANSISVEQMRAQGATDYALLAEQLKERREKQQRR